MGRHPAGPGLLLPASLSLPLPSSPLLPHCTTTLPTCSPVHLVPSCLILSCSRAGFAHVAAASPGPGTCQHPDKCSEVTK